MEARSFEEINAEVDNSPIQHYISSLRGYVNAGEAVLVDEEFLLPADLRSKFVTIIQKQEASPSWFIVNFYVFLRPNGIEVPRLPVPWKITYVGFPAQEVLQTQYLSVVPEARLQALVYFIREGEILSGWKAFCLGMSDCFFFTASSLDDLRGPTSGRLSYGIGLSESNATNLVHSGEIIPSDHGGSS